MSDQMRDILNRVAAGEITPEEAQRQLGAIDPTPEPVDHGAAE